MPQKSHHKIKFSTGISYRRYPNHTFNHPPPFLLSTNGYQKSPILHGTAYHPSPIHAICFRNTTLLGRCLSIGDNLHTRPFARGKTCHHDRYTSIEAQLTIQGLELSSLLQDLVVAILAPFLEKDIAHSVSKTVRYLPSSLEPKSHPHPHE